MQQLNTVSIGQIRHHEGDRERQRGWIVEDTKKIIRRVVGWIR
jgi:hypothetical protein